MGVGLGKNSPIILTLGKDNYEALIDRHGQWCRWRTARKCTCTKEGTGQPDLHCPKCAGRGWVYGYQKSKEVYTIVQSDGSKYLSLDREYASDALVTIYNNKNEEVGGTKVDNFILFDEPATKSEYYTIVMTRQAVKEADELSAKSEAVGYSLPLFVKRTGVDGLYHKAACDILSIDKVIDASGAEFKIVEYRQNKFFLEAGDDNTGKPILPILCKGVRYIEPATLLLLSQNLEERDAQEVLANKGDAVLSFPYNLNIATGDVITVLAGVYLCKDIIVKRYGVDILPNYFVQRILSITGEREYIADKDFELVGNNRIMWICDDAPAVSTNLSIEYNVFPTYTVMATIPQLRTSENQRIPRKVVVKLMSGYSEKRGFSRQ